jgi:hypothetical protein
MGQLLIIRLAPSLGGGELERDSGYLAVGVVHEVIEGDTAHRTGSGRQRVVFRCQSTDVVS